MLQNYNIYTSETIFSPNFELLGNLLAFTPDGAESLAKSCFKSKIKKFLLITKIAL